MPLPYFSSVQRGRQRLLVSHVRAGQARQERTERGEAGWQVQKAGEETGQKTGRTEIRSKTENFGRGREDGENHFLLSEADFLDRLYSDQDLYRLGLKVADVLVVAWTTEPTHCQRYFISILQMG